MTEKINAKNQRPTKSAQESGSVLIGGSNDGAFINVVGGTNFLKMPKLRHIHTYGIGDEIPRSQIVNYEFYRAETYRSGSREWTVFILEGISLEAAFESLINGYKPNVTNEFRCS